MSVIILSVERKLNDKEHDLEPFLNMTNTLFFSLPYATSSRPCSYKS